MERRVKSLTAWIVHCTYRYAPIMADLGFFRGGAAKGQKKWSRCNHGKPRSDRLGGSEGGVTQEDRVWGNSPQQGPGAVPLVRGALRWYFFDVIYVFRLFKSSRGFWIFLRSLTLPLCRCFLFILFVLFLLYTEKNLSDEKRGLESPSPQPPYIRHCPQCLKTNKSNHDLQKRVCTMYTHWCTSKMLHNYCTVCLCYLSTMCSFHTLNWDRV